MKQTITQANMFPTAHICINKTRMKLYNKETDPTYYLTVGTEFSIELFNPTSNVVLAKITLNGKLISQGGLVLNPGQHVFLERYLDIAKKFLFHTYEVSGSAEVQKAVEKNGDFKVEFFKEQLPIYMPPIDYTWGPHIYFNNIGRGGSYINGGIIGGSATSISTASNSVLRGMSSINNLADGHGMLTNSLSDAGTFQCSSASYSANAGEATLDMLGMMKNIDESVKNPSAPKKREKKTIETGRVEPGYASSQEFRTVDKTFEYSAFHKIECKLLPVSQKVNTIEDLNVKVYCTQWGSKLGKTDKFCSSCGHKA